MRPPSVSATGGEQLKEQARTEPAASALANTQVSDLLKANRKLVDSLAAAAPSVPEITRLRFALQFPDDSEARDKLTKMVAWREGTGRPIVEAAAAAVAQATAGGAWDNEPVRAAAPHGDFSPRPKRSPDCLKRTPDCSLGLTAAPHV